MLPIQVITLALFEQAEFNPGEKMIETNKQQCWSIPTAFWLIIALATVLIAYPFMETINDMIYRWDTKEEYGYGYIIPFITLFLIWQRKEKLAEQAFEPTLLAVPLLILSGLIYFVGAVSTTHTLSQYALVMTLLSLAYGILGWRAFKIVAIPIFLLFFMVPLPPFIYNNLSGKLQLLSSEMGVAVIRAFDISVYLEGNVIDLGTYKLQVVEACSGLRYLFPLVSLSFVAAYLYSVETWKRVIIFLSSIPITVFMNSFRIGVIGVLVEYYGIEQAEGFLHDFEGWIIFMACMGILFVEMAILARIGKNKRKLSEVFGIEVVEPADKDCEKKVQKVGFVHYALLATLALYSVSTLYIQERVDTKLERKSFDGFPLAIDNWKGHRTYLERKILDSLKADDYIMVDYDDGSNMPVNFYIAYYASQQAGSAAHSPRACIPGGGWKINDLQTVDLDGVTFMGKPLSVNRMIIKKGDFGQLVYYWFQQRDRVVTNEYMVKWYLFWDALTRNRTDGSLVRLTIPFSPGVEAADADKKMAVFLNEVEPVVKEYLPE